MEALQRIFFLVSAGIGLVIIADAISLSREYGRAIRVPMLQYGIGGSCLLAIGLVGLLTDASVTTPVPGPWTRFDATETVATVGVIEPLIVLGLVLPPKRHLGLDRGPLIGKLFRRDE